MKFLKYSDIQIFYIFQISRYFKHIKYLKYFKYSNILNVNLPCCPMPIASSNLLEVDQLNQQPSISKSSLIWSNLNFIFVFDRIKKWPLRVRIFQMYGSRTDHEFQEHDHDSRVACMYWTNCCLAAMIVAAKLSHCKSHKYIWQFKHAFGNKHDTSCSSDKYKMGRILQKSTYLLLAVTMVAAIQLDDL